MDGNREIFGRYLHFTESVLLDAKGTTFKMLNTYRDRLKPCFKTFSISFLMMAIFPSVLFAKLVKVKCKCPQVMSLLIIKLPCQEEFSYFLPKWSYYGWEDLKWAPCIGFSIECNILAGISQGLWIYSSTPTFWICNGCSKTVCKFSSLQTNDDRVLGNPF